MGPCGPVTSTPPAPAAAATLTTAPMLKGLRGFSRSTTGESAGPSRMFFGNGLGTQRDGYYSGIRRDGREQPEVFGVYFVQAVPHHLVNIRSHFICKAKSGVSVGTDHFQHLRTEAQGVFHRMNAIQDSQRLVPASLPEAVDQFMVSHLRIQLTYT